jgi:hypothetical protein
MRSILVQCLSAILLLGLAACQTNPEMSTDSTGVTYSKTIHDLHVWKVENFQFQDLKGKSIVVPPATSEVAPQQKPEEVQQFERLRRVLRDQIVYSLEDRKVFSSVRGAETAQGGDYELQIAVVEYYPGNVALRLTVGFSAGHPSITVRGTIREVSTGRSVFQFRTQREFEMRMFEVTDEHILENNIKDLAVDFSDYLNRSISGQPLKD